MLGDGIDPPQLRLETIPHEDSRSLNNSAADDHRSVGRGLACGGHQLQIAGERGRFDSQERLQVVNYDPMTERGSRDFEIRSFVFRAKYIETRLVLEERPGIPLVLVEIERVNEPNLFHDSFGERIRAKLLLLDRLGNAEWPDPDDRPECLIDGKGEHRDGAGPQPS
ncbi:MAG TPA: hypothetical protein VNU84_06550 [Candidatus Acidoferrum sp.]|nr:hypothetical protein [Candidatus Acidoferrum sp.]